MATKLYGASCVFYSPKAEKGLAHLENLGFGRLPICMAKTQYSLSDDPSLLGRPTDFTLTVRDVYVSLGAGFVVVLTGDMMTMPGLPKFPGSFICFSVFEERNQSQGYALHRSFSAAKCLQSLILS